ncbi:MAG: hypothetical protein FWH42_03115 [Dehalococcoidia bacterium]|nr:hypothetical protein [Dehalococcoidia bacterium]
MSSQLRLFTDRFKLWLIDSGRWKTILLGTVFCLLHILIFMRVFPHVGADTELYYSYATKMKEGLIPYRDYPAFKVEYTPIAMLIFFIPSLFVQSIEGYFTAFAVEMMLFNLAGIWLIIGLAKQLKKSVLVALICYTLIILINGAISVQRFDMAPAVITLAVLYFFCRGKYELAWVVLVVGIMTKLFPAVLAPLFIIYQWKRYGWKQLEPSMVVGVLTLGLIAGPALILGAEGFINSITVQSARAIQLESLYSSILLLGDSLGLVTATTVQGPMSFDISSPLGGVMSSISFVIMATVFFLVYLLYFFRAQHDRDSNFPQLLSEKATADIIHYTFVAIAVFIITSKVFSPQFILWICPLVPLFSGKYRLVGWSSFLLALALTQYIFPLNYYWLADGQQVPVNALVIRNTMMVLMIVLMLIHPRREQNQGINKIELLPQEG